MAIASWSGPLRKYKETAVHMKEAEAILTVKNYVVPFVKGEMEKSTALTAIQSTLGLCFGNTYNFRRFINSALNEFVKKSVDEELLLKKLLKECKDFTKE